MNGICLDSFDHTPIKLICCFNSPIYIFLFLPIVVLGYYLLNRRRLVVAGKAWLVLASLFFYGYWNPKYLLLIISSILVNFAVGIALHRRKKSKQSDHHPAPSRRNILIAGIIFNIGLLGYFKYADFFIDNLNMALSTELSSLGLILPLAISFYTFQQIAYLVDCSKEDTEEYDFLSYCLFVSFFPQLIAGPIVHHREMMPQFKRLRCTLLDWHNISMGLFIFSIGLFKKIVLADSFAIWADKGFDSVQALTLYEGWITSLSYTFQLYYDFSGYTDMAIGAALLFNIRLPINFNSPYKACDIRDFWQRWHITLSRWLRDYIYIPLGGNRAGKNRAYLNVLITFVLGGLWHGAGWTFVVWGSMHGVALVIHRAWSRAGFKMPLVLGWFCTFMFLNATWVFFRATTFEGAVSVLKSMVGLNGIGVSGKFMDLYTYLAHWSFIEFVGVQPNYLMPVDSLVYIVVFGIIAFTLPNTVQMIRFVPYRGSLEFKTRFIFALFIGCILFYSLVAGIQNAPSVFLYFNF